ncbi:MAG TPA: hypothetical protein VEV63_07235 [Streptosporangiaceae bacterium]|nr:hypothetical protein [Streptosporangiaceae bacterium]
MTRGPRGRLAMRGSPRPRRPVRRVLIGTAVLVVAAVVLAAYLLRHPHSIAPPAPLLSDFERSSRADIVRDCGYSQPLPADRSVSLWLFCDTAVYAATSRGKWQLSRVIGGSTAAESPATAGTVPDDLSELTTPGKGVTAVRGQDGPARFLPAPSGLKTADGLDCDLANKAYSASWPTGVTADPARGADILITFNNYCVMATGDLLPEGFGLAEYDPAANTFRAVATVFTAAGRGPLGPQELLGSPIFSGSYLYLFASRCAEADRGTCLPHGGSAIYLARVSANPSAWRKPGSYQWFAGNPAWTASPAAAASVIPGAAPAGVSVNSFSALGRGLVLIEQTNDVGRFVVYQAASPAGPWHKIMSGTVPTAIKGTTFTRAIIGHPDLSTGSELLVTFFDPSAAPYRNRRDGPKGHVIVASFPWPDPGDGRPPA